MGMDCRWVGDWGREDITSTFGVRGKIKMEGEFWDERGLHVGNKYFKHKNIYTYTR